MTVITFNQLLKNAQQKIIVMLNVSIQCLNLSGST